MLRLGQVEGIGIPFLGSPHFQEFVVSFDGAGKTVAEINEALLARGILGGRDLTQEFPELGQSALYSVSEVHTQEDIDRLADALQEVVAR
jgi:glycine dehydrogenase subunit 1